MAPTAAAAAAAAILSSILVQYLAASRESGASELSSEVLAWALLPALYKAGQSLRLGHLLPKAIKSGAGSGTTSFLWQCAIAGGIAALEFFKEDNGMFGLWLALPPLILAAQRFPQTSPLSLSEPSDLSSHAPEALSNGSWHRTMRSPLVGAATAGTLALLANLALTRWRFLPFGISAVFVAIILFAAYRAFMHKSGEDTARLSEADANDATVVFSLRICLGLVVALLVQIFFIAVFEFSIGQLMPTVFLGLAKATSWFFLLLTARDVSWAAAMSVGGFGIMSSLDPSRQPSAGCALFNVIVACLALAHVISALPKQDKFRHLLWILCLFSVAPWFSNVVEIRAANHGAVLFSKHHSHPAEGLMLAGKTDFKALLQRQSKTLEAARAEYRRRYKIDPPKGFDAWYDYAASHHSPIIDDFDAIYKSVSPFWRLSGSEVIEAMRRLQSDPRLRTTLWRCDFSGQSGRTKCINPYRRGDRHISLLFSRLLGDLRGVLPDVTMLVNHLDEPMVIIPPTSVGPAGSPGTQITSTDMSHRPIWNSITKFCSHYQEEKANASDSTTTTTAAAATATATAKIARSAADYILAFVDDVSSSMDLCQHPEYGRMHGLFMSPTSSILVEGLAPILSVGAPSTMGDILFPSAAYIERGFLYDETTDVDWESKADNLYWAGSNTGGYAADDSWRLFQRQRFLSLAQNKGQRAKQYSYLREEGGVAGRVQTPFLNSNLFDVSLTRIFQCKERYCRDQKLAFNTRFWADKNEALRSKLAFDLDGNGISGRWYKLLASKSTPLKQTLFREWHDERLVPWVHYIPVSQGLEELPELVTYLTSTEAGQQRAREVAEQGREWYRKALREVDMGIYMYRLMLELARLQDPLRKADQQVRP